MPEVRIFLRGDFLALAGLVLAFVLFNFVWLWHFRHGQLLTIDEAGYIDIALTDYQSLIHGGWLSFIQAVEAPSIQAPVTTVLGALVFVLAGPHILAAFSVTVLSGAGCVVAAFFLARALGMGRLSLLPALLVASCPFIINYSRDFQFSMPTALMATASLVCLLNSQRMRRPGWGVLFGVFLGLMPLSRSMTLAFLPALVVGAFIYVYIDGFTEWRRKTFWLAIALLVGLLIALSWFIPNGRYVFQYLLGFGYGHHAAEYNNGEGKIGFASLLDTIRLLGSYICLPQFLLLLAALPAGVATFMRLGVKDGLAGAILQLLRSPIIPVLAFVCGVVLALSSTVNKGDGFIAPAVPAMLVLACLELQSICRGALLRRIYIGAVVLISGFGVLSTSGLLLFGKASSVTIPVFGDINLTSGIGVIQAYESAGQLGGGGNWPIPAAEGHIYADVYKEVAIAFGGKKVAFGFRDFLFNVNTILLYQTLLEVPRAHSIAQIDPTMIKFSPEGVSAWLTMGQAASTCFLLLSNEVIHQFPPAIPSAVVEAGALKAGFKSSGTVWVLPDGERLMLWRRGECQ